MKIEFQKVAPLFLVVLFFSSPALAANFLDVVINEIAWMGREASPNDEWIELYNNSSSQITLDGWKLVAEDGTPEISLKGKIPSKGFFLLERTDDETLPNIKADLIYKGSLSNKGEDLKLIDSKGNLIDEVDCSSGWFEGDNKTKRTMERKDALVSGSDPENWQLSKEPGGTPKDKNNVTKREIKTKKKTETKIGRKFYPSNVFINEILPSPEGPDAENEWIEIFNGNNFEVDLTDWKIRDKVGAVKTYKIPQGTKIEAFSFLVLKRPETKITLQNSVDGLELLDPTGKVVDKVNYQKAPLGQSFNRTPQGWKWSTTLTPGKKNIIAPLELAKKENKETLSKAPVNQKKESNKQLPSKDISLAKIGEKTSNPSSPLTTFLIALIIAIGSAIIVFFLKKRLVGEELEVEETKYKL
jgi:hypothetical protein